MSNKDTLLSSLVLLSCSVDQSYSKTSLELRLVLELKLVLALSLVLCILLSPLQHYIYPSRLSVIELPRSIGITLLALNGRGRVRHSSLPSVRTNFT